MGEKLTIFDGEESVLYTFNETASYIFSKLKLGWERMRISQALSKKYKIKPDKLTKDVTEFIRDLKKKKIVST